MDARDRDVIARLAAEYAELAARPDMAVKRDVWRRMNDLDPIRPLYLFETDTILDFVQESELACTSQETRSLERRLRADIRHVSLIDDDKVLEPSFWLDVPISDNGYGVNLVTLHARDSIGYVYNHPVDSLDKIGLLRPRTFRADRETPLRLAEELSEIFPPTLGIGVRGPAVHLPQISGNLYRLIGMDRFYLWLIDEPDAIERIAGYLADTYIGFLDWLEQEDLLALNSSNDLVGSGSYGYVSSLPSSPIPGRPATSRDLWGWMESQETASIDPERFTAHILPAMAKVARRFGLVYYGCCEQLHDRFEAISAAMPNIRSVSVSPWSDQERMAAMLRGRCVFSRKMPPQYMSGAACDLESLSDDVDATLRINTGGCTEFIYRDVYDIGHDLSRLAGFGRMMRAKTGL